MNILESLLNKVTVLINQLHICYLLMLGVQMLNVFKFIYLSSLFKLIY